VELPDGNRKYRVLPFRGGRIKLNPIDGEKAAFKLCQILGKTTIKKGATQLNLHDGRSLVLSNGETGYNVKDVLQLSVPEQEILSTIRFEEGVIAIITGGRLQGRQGIISGFGSEPGWKKTATLRTPDGEDIRTLSKYIFPIGSAEPLISMPIMPAWGGS
jgi:small subunit ribosomal protein S4e